MDRLAFASRLDSIPFDLLTERMGLLLKQHKGRPRRSFDAVRDHKNAKKRAKSRARRG